MCNCQTTTYIVYVGTQAVALDAGCCEAVTERSRGFATHLIDAKPEVCLPEKNYDCTRLIQVDFAEVTLRRFAGPRRLQVSTFLTDGQHQIPGGWGVLSYTIPAKALKCCRPSYLDPFPSLKQTRSFGSRKRRGRDLRGSSARHATLTGSFQSLNPSLWHFARKTTSSNGP